MNIVISQITMVNDSQPYKARKIHDKSCEEIQELEQQLAASVEKEAVEEDEENE